MCFEYAVLSYLSSKTVTTTTGGFPDMAREPLCFELPENSHMKPKTARPNNIIDLKWLLLILGRPDLRGRKGNGWESLRGG